MSVRSVLTGAPTRAARWSATHPWRSIALWFAFVIAATALASFVSTEEPSDADYRIGQSGHAEAMIAAAGLDQPSTEDVLITSASGGLDRRTADRAAADVATALGSVDGVAGVGKPVPSGDGTALLVPVTLTSDDVEPAPLLAATKHVQDAYPGLHVREAGDVSLDAAIDDRVGSDLGHAETTSLPITLILMLLAFGALIAAGLPVLLAASSVAATIGIMAPVSHFVPADMTVSSMIVLIGMAVGVDYSLFYLKRERQEREAGRHTLDAVAIAAETSGHAILVSGIAVIGALAGLFVLADPTFNSLATSAIIVVAVAVLGSITVLPALLVKLGRWVDRPRVPLLWRLTRRTRRGSVAGLVLGPVVRHPVAALVGSAVVVGALAVPAFGMKTHDASLDTLPTDITEVQTLRAIRDHYPSEGATVKVVLRADGSTTTGTPAAALRGLSKDAAASGDFSAVSRPDITTSRDGRTSVLVLPLPHDETDSRSADAVELLRDKLAPAALDGAGVWAIGGDAAESLDYSTHMNQRLPILLGFVLLLTFLTMAGAFRSLVLGGVSTLLNLASVGVALGVLTVVFQHGFAASVLDFTSPGYVIGWIPIFVLVVLVGLSMDYHVFVLSRVRELVAGGMTTRDAVRRGVAETAGIVTSAATVMVSVFALFATLSMMEMKMMGVGLAAAILLDATLIRLVALPALLVLLGERTWWPVRPAARASEPRLEPVPEAVAAVPAAVEAARM